MDGFALQVGSEGKEEEEEGSFGDGESFDWAREAVDGRLEDAAGREGCAVENAEYRPCSQTCYAASDEEVLCGAGPNHDGRELF